MVNGLNCNMLKITKTLDERRFSGGKMRTVVEALCQRCGQTSEMLKQNVKKHNDRGSGYCQHCIGDAYHQMTGTRIWRIWQGMMSRHKGTSDPKHYADRGIQVCNEWHDFKTFYNDMCDGYSDELTIERIDVHGPYCKENCRWATNMEQQANKRTNRVVQYQGEQIHLAELCRRSGFSKMMLSMRLNRGMTGDEAVEDARNSPYGKGPRAKKNRMSMTS